MLNILTVFCFDNDNVMLSILTLLTVSSWMVMLTIDNADFFNCVDYVLFVMMTMSTVFIMLTLWC